MSLLPTADELSVLAYAAIGGAFDAEVAPYYGVDEGRDGPERRALNLAASTLLGREVRLDVDAREVEVHKHDLRRNGPSSAAWVAFGARAKVLSELRR